MRSIVVISELDIWSMGREKGAQSLWHTLLGYADRQWNVFFLTPYKINTSYQKLHKNIIIESARAGFLHKLAHIKKIGFFFRPLWWIYFQIKMFVLGSKTAKNHKIDVFYGYEIMGIPAAKLLSLRFKKPSISRFQGTILKPKMDSILWKLKYWHHYIGLKVPTDLTIMTNDGTQGNKVLSQLNVDMSKVKFWMNGVNKDIYKPDFNIKAFKKSLAIPEQTRIILSISRLVYWKRVDRIIVAMKKIVPSFPDVKLLIIGDGPEKNKLEKLSTSLLLNEKVRFLGSLPHNQVFDFLNSADLFVSLYDLSNVGNPLLEAMACGQCIVTLNTGDTGIFIQNEHNGILLDLEKIDMLPNIICRLLKDDEKRQLLGKKAKEFAERNFWDWNERMEAEIKAVERLLI